MPNTIKSSELEKFFKAAKKLKPKYNLSAEEMDEINERMFRKNT